MLLRWLPRAGAGWLLLGAGAILCLAGYKAAEAYRAERRGFLPSPHPPRLAPSEFGVDGLKAASFPSRSGARLAGVFAPSRNGAAVILTHGSGGDHCDLAAEVQILGRAGFGVLAFDWPGHGESQGDIQWAESERLALKGAIDWLGAQSGVDPQRIGVLGFSMGGLIVTQVAAEDARLRAVALAGTPHNPREQTRWEYRRWGFVTEWPAFYAIQRSGLNLDQGIPEELVARIAPRPLLLVSGGKDEVVPPWMSERLYRAAAEPKRLLSIAGAGHGGYRDADASAYSRALLDFFGALSA